MNENKNDERRGFIKTLLTGGMALSVFSLFTKKASASSVEKIKMLTADGKLVEIDQSVLKKNTSDTPVSNVEVVSWMNSNKKKI